MAQDDLWELKYGLPCSANNMIIQLERNSTKLIKIMDSLNDIERSVIKIIANLERGSKPE